jgi:tRNA(Ile)-lysidine synthase
LPERPRLTPAIADVRRAVRAGFDLAGLASGDQVLVACSGGADSMALAAAAAFEGQRAGILVGAVIVEHGLQPETKQVAERTAEVLSGLGLEPVTAVPVSVGSAGGVEAAAREARYAALTKAAEGIGAKAVLLGHTLNDQAETVLLGLARGSGAKSLWGMAVHSGLWLRPLLGITRDTTEACCTESGIDFWVDPHNSDTRYSRVRVRSSVLPVLESELGPGVAESLARTAELLRQDGEYLASVSQAEFQRIARVGATGITFSVSALEALPPAILSRVILAATEKFGAAAQKIHVDEVLQLVTNWHGQKELTLPGIRVVRQGDDLTLKSAKTLKLGAC